MNKVSLNIEKIEQSLLHESQADCPVAHHFGPGVYIREVTMLSGTFAIGHAQRYEHLNILVKGKVAMIDGDVVKVVEAPLIFTGKPGRKMGYVIETCVWQNVYATNETDIDKLELHYLDKSDVWNLHESIEAKLRYQERSEDREDFDQMLTDVGVDAETVRKQSESTLDQIPLPDCYKAVVSIRDSNIEGKGLFLSWHMDKEVIIAPARISGKRTPAGRYVNHSKTPNCKYILMENGDIYLQSMREIKGCCGGDKGEELTVDYRQAIKTNKLGEQICQV